MQSLEKVQVKKELKVKKEEPEEPTTWTSPSPTKPTRTTKRRVEKEIAYYSKLPSCSKMTNNSNACSCLVVVS